MNPRMPVLYNSVYERVCVTDSIHSLSEVHVWQTCLNEFPVSLRFLPCTANELFYSVGSDLGFI